MPETAASADVALEVISPDGSRSFVPVARTPYYIGRGEAENHLQLPDRRISRQCAAIDFEGSNYQLQDRGHRLGIFVNGQKISRHALQDGDVITFGIGDSYQIVFRHRSSDPSIENLLDRMGSIASSQPSSAGGLGKLNLLLEATMLLHSHLPLDAVLDAMLDRAITITDADRALLIEADATGALHNRLARRAGSESLPPENFAHSQTAVRLAIEKQSGIVTEDLNQADAMLQVAESIITQRLRSIVAIPLYAMVRANTAESMVRVARGEFLGVLYLDSRRRAAFSKIDRQILDAIAIESASILDNARLVERERQRQRIEQELSIARNIQQALLPRGFRDFPHLTVSGVNLPCHACGGDYFDVFPMKNDRTAFLIADVSGKGLGAALVTTMLQGALSGMTIGVDPAHVLQHINDFLCAHSEVRRYATLFFGILDSDGSVEYFNAGHPQPLLLRRGAVTELFTEGSLPIGLVPEATFVSSRVALEDGDTLVLFSDGVTEAMSADERMFEISRLCEILAGRHDAPLGELQKLIVDAVENFARGAEQADDITVLLVRYSAAVKRAISDIQVPS